MTKFVILDRQKMTFWTTYIDCVRTHVMYAITRRAKNRGTYIVSQRALASRCCRHDGAMNNNDCCRCTKHKAASWVKKVGGGASRIVGKLHVSDRHNYGCSKFLCCPKFQNFKIGDFQPNIFKEVDFPPRKKISESPKFWGTVIAPSPSLPRCHCLTGHVRCPVPFCEMYWHRRNTVCTAT